MNMKVLVAYGSKHGGTEGIAKVIGDTLATEGDEVDVQPARTVKSVDPFDVVVVGGALYANRWHKDARRLVRKHTANLRCRQVWFFSSGPLDDSAATEEIPPTSQVAKLIDQVGARNHMTFGGYLAEDVKGFPASAMAKDHAGDWRDRERIAEWARRLHTSVAGT